MGIRLNYQHVQINCRFLCCLGIFFPPPVAQQVSCNAELWFTEVALERGGFDLVVRFPGFAAFS